MERQISSFSDYHVIVRDLQEIGLVGPGIPFAVLIGCSGHSPIPNRLFARVVELIGNQIIESKIKTVWGGGDPCFRRQNQGKNIGDVLKALLANNQITTVAACQRNDWLAKTPEFETIRVGYHAHMAIVEGAKTFGGFERKACDGLVEYLDNLNKHSLENLDASVNNTTSPITISTDRLIQEREQEQGEEQDMNPSTSVSDTIVIADDDPELVGLTGRMRRRKRKRLLKRRQKAQQESLQSADSAIDRKHRHSQLSAASVAVSMNDNTNPTIPTNDNDNNNNYYYYVGKSTINQLFLPRHGAYPVAATLAYLSLLPALSNTRELVLFVIPSAGMITFREVKYTCLLLDSIAQRNAADQRFDNHKHCAGEQEIRAPTKVAIYAVTWPGMEQSYDKKRCKVREIMQALRQAKTKHPDSVHFLNL